MLSKILICIRLGGQLWIKDSSGIAWNPSSKSNLICAVIVLIRRYLPNFSYTAQQRSTF
jgi:hypothetical protein